MVQRKSPNKLSIKHLTLNKIMKNSKPLHRSDQPPPENMPASPPPPPPKASPNYMKSTTSFEARKESSPKSTPNPSKTSKKHESSSASLKPTKSPNFKFKPLRPSKKTTLYEKSQKATCSSTLKQSQFPDHLQLSHGGISAMKVCPYTYCSLNGHHHHAPLPPLKRYMAAGRRALKTQKGFSFELGPVMEEAVDMEAVSMSPEMEENEEIRDLFVGEVYGENSSRDLGCSGNVYDELREVYDEESVSSGAWTEEDGDSESEISSDLQSDVSSIATESDWQLNEQQAALQLILDDKTDPNKADRKFSIGDQNNIECSIDYEQEKVDQQSKTIPDSAENSKEKPDTNHTTIIYNIVHVNISVFFNGEKPENDKTVAMKDDQEPAGDSAELKTREFASETDNKKTEIPSFCKKPDSNELLQEPCRELTRGEKRDPDTGYEDSDEFKLRGPNFLPEVAGPDAETVDLKHQDIDERKNAEEFMVDYALQKAVNTIAQKRKVSALVKAFEKVMPVSEYEIPRKRKGLETFTDARPMQACN